MHSNKTKNDLSLNAFLNKLCYIFVVVACFVLFLLFIFSQEHNWDMLGYAASVLTLDNLSAVEIHDYVYGELKVYASIAEYEKLTLNDSYRETMFLDADAFMQQVPYYKIRIVFVGLIYLLYSAGVNIFLACHLVCAAASTLGCFVFFHAYQTLIKPVSITALFPFLALTTGVVNIGQTVTADSLAFLWIALISWAFIKNHWIVFPLLITSVLIRTDLIILVALMLAYLFIFRSEKRLHVLASSIVAALVYFGINKFAGNYGWSTVFYYVFVSDMLATHPGEFAKLGLSLQQYLSAVVESIPDLLYDNMFWTFFISVLLQVILCIHYKIPDDNFWQKDNIMQGFFIFMRNPVTALTLISCAYVALHYFLFPVLWSRFFVAQYMIAALGLFYTVSCFIAAEREPQK